MLGNFGGNKGKRRRRRSAPGSLGSSREILTTDRKPLLRSRSGFLRQLAVNGRLLTATLAVVTIGAIVFAVLILLPVGSPTEKPTDMEQVAHPEPSPVLSSELVRLGRKALEDGDLEQAEFYFRESIKHYPMFSIAWIELAFIRLDLGDAKGAQELAEKCSELDPSNSLATGLQAVLASNRGDYERSIQLAQAGLEAAPLNPICSNIYLINMLKLGNEQKVRDRIGDTQEFSSPHIIASSIVAEAALANREGNHSAMQAAISRARQLIPGRSLEVLLRSDEFAGVEQ